MTILNEEQMAFKKIWDTEKSRVALCVDEAIEDITEIGGDIPLFSKGLLLAHIELETELNGPEFTVIALIRCAEALSKKHNLAGTC